MLAALIQKVDHMNQEETQAFADLNSKVDAQGQTITTLATAVVGLATEVTTEAQALKDALNANDTAGVLAAASILSSKIDANQAKATDALTAAQAALNPPAAPAPVVAPPADPAAASPTT